MARAASRGVVAREDNAKYFLPVAPDGGAARKTGDSTPRAAAAARRSSGRPVVIGRNEGRGRRARAARERATAVIVLARPIRRRPREACAPRNSFFILTSERISSKKNEWMAMKVPFMTTPRRKRKM